jgi:putative copper export protein
MTMTPSVRKFLLTAHLVSSLGWIGAVVAYLALVVAALTSEDAETVRAAFRAMELTYFVLVPLAVASLLTGVVQALGTTWGLFRHYWVLSKLLLTVVATTVLLLHMPAVNSLAEAAAETDRTDLPGAGHELLHAGVGLLVLLTTAILGVYKPRGMTRYGLRKQDELRTLKQEEQRSVVAR